MCGRFTFRLDLNKVIKELSVDKVLNEFKPNYNACPTQEVPIVIQEENKRILDTRKWGLIPHWAKDKKIAYKMINARAETISEKPSFKSAFLNRRCLIVADGFYEWKRSGTSKIPFYIHLKDREVFGFAGIWETWNDIKTCSIITTESNSFMKKLHHRMPVIIPKQLEKHWLDPEIKEKGLLMELLKPYPSSQMTSYKVSSDVNSPKNNKKELLKPIK